MSNNIGYFEDIGTDNGQPMCVTAFVGKDWDASVQFTIGMNYCAMDSNDIKELIHMLQCRLDKVEGFRATD